MLFLYHRLNPAQVQAVQSALTQSVTMIQGPPGTGKTHVAASIVRHAVDANVKVLVAAETNVAVDNLARKVWNGGQFTNFVRLAGSGGDKVSPDLVQFTLEDGKLATLAETTGRKVAYRDQATGKMRYKAFNILEANANGQ